MAGDERTATGKASNKASATLAGHGIGAGMVGGHPAASSLFIRSAVS